MFAPFETIVWTITFGTFLSFASLTQSFFFCMKIHIFVLQHAKHKKTERILYTKHKGFARAVFASKVERKTMDVTKTVGTNNEDKHERIMRRAVVHPSAFPADFAAAGLFKPRN
jgi:hypothetical protein